LLIVFVGYYYVFNNSKIAQIAFLTTCSLFFYGYADPSLIVLLIVSLLVNGWIVFAICKQDEKLLAQRRGLLLLALVFNLGLLAYYKYAYLIASMVLTPPAHKQLLASIKAIPLPVGISFYTFQTLSLVLDVYRKKRHGLERLLDEKTPWKFHLYIWFYISFFPQLVAGPIVKAHEFLDQIEKKTYSQIDWYKVVKYLIIGYFLKTVSCRLLNRESAARRTSPFLTAQTILLNGIGSEVKDGLYLVYMSSVSTGKPGFTTTSHQPSLETPSLPDIFTGVMRSPTPSIRTVPP